MPEKDKDSAALSVLPTQLEEDFIAPLTAMRGALEILRDFPDLSQDDHARFVTSALEECARIERGLRHLGAAVYRDAREQSAQQPDALVALHEDTALAELNFSGIDFDGADAVNQIFDRVQSRIADTGRRWWFLVNFTDCHVFPEAWIAFAHRGKEIRVKYGYGTIRFAEDGEAGLPDRAAALLQIAEAKAALTN